jgi:hypothetical protein
MKALPFGAWGRRGAAVLLTLSAKKMAVYREK